MRRLLVVLSVIALALGMLTPAAAADGFDRTAVAVPDRLADTRLDAPAQANFKLTDDLRAAVGTQRVIVRLAPEASVADVARAQGAFMARARTKAPNARVLATTRHVLNAVFMDVDAAALAALAADPAVERIARVADYELDLSETVPYIGATAVQGLGFDGAGVSVAVLDSGVDYYHANLGGSGDPDEYAADNHQIIEEGTFPTDKVVGGFDFVGPDWVGGDGSPPEAPDPDPIDGGGNAGHGTHVADIIAGVGGVAPGADIYAVKVCSSESNSCSGIALIQGMDFAVDPNGDGDTSDHVDIINMSLGSVYGQPFDDDLSAAVDAATGLGVLTVASAGNSADKPFVTGSPSATGTALSVAQTAVPSAVLPLLEALEPESIAGTYAAVFQPWSAPLTEVIEGPLVYGDGAGGNLDGCALFDADLSGKIVLIDRGTCFFSTKIQNVEAAGGLAGIIGLIAPGDPFAGGFGGGDFPGIPGFMISQADSNTLKSGLPDAVVRFDPAVGIPLIMHMVGSSSRGPQFGNQMLKPEIGAPGASISATAGTGTGVEPFGGTSGAAPMVSGSAALLLQAYPDRTPLEIKAVLMNNGETDIINDPLTGALAPVSRIGGGEVRVDRALASPAAAWDSARPAGAVSFGFHDITKSTQVLTRRVVVHNYSDQLRTYSITPTFRFAEDETGAVTVHTPNAIAVPPNSSRSFPVQLRINGALLPDNAMNSGSQGANGAALTAMEFDGYLILDDGDDPLHVAWHALPRKAADVRAAPRFLSQGDVSVNQLRNLGQGQAHNDVYSLLGVSPNIPEGDRGEQSPTPDLRAVGVQTFFVGEGFCTAFDPADPQYVLALAFNTWEREAHADAPAEMQAWLDTNQDGTEDFVVRTLDLAFPNLSDGRNVAWVVDLETGGASAFFFTEHNTLTGNYVALLCGSQLIRTDEEGNVTLPAPAIGEMVDARFVANDVYFGGPDDEIAGISFAPLGERYLPFNPDDGTLFPDLDLAAGESKTMYTADTGDIGSSEIGVLIFTNGDRGAGDRGAASHATEAIVLPDPEHRVEVLSILGG